MKREYPMQVKVNTIHAAELEKENNNEAETSKVNSLAFIEDNDNVKDIILFVTQIGSDEIFSRQGCRVLIKWGKCVRVLTK